MISIARRVAAASKGHAIPEARAIQELTQACKAIRKSERYFAVDFRFFAQYAFIRSACCFRWAAVNLRDRFFKDGSVPLEETAPSALGGRPRRFVPWSTSIARFNLSRS